MRKVIIFALAAVFLSAAQPMTARAGLSDFIATNGLYNKIKFTNYETFFRKVGDDDFEVIDPEDATDDDYLLSVFAATELAVQTAPGVFTFDTVWQKGSTDGTYFLGYSVQGIDTITFDGSDIDAIVYENPDYDPFFRLTPDVETIISYESDTDWTITGDITTDVATIAGTEWATFGIGDAPDGASFTANPSPLGRLGDSDFALSNITGADGITFTTGDDFGSDIIGNATIYVPGVGDWVARSEDPMVFSAVPEPGTLAMWGSFLVIGGAIAWRRRRS